MEAATTGHGSLLPRDGAVPAAPQTPDATSNAPREPIDGVARCACCERFPLVGEQVVMHVGRKRSGWVCDRCEAAGRGDRLGAAGARVRVRSFGGAMNVRRAI